MFLGKKLTLNFGFGKVCISKHHALSILKIFRPLLPNSKSFPNKKTSPLKIVCLPHHSMRYEVNREGAT